MKKSYKEQKTEYAIKDNEKIFIVTHNGVMRVIKRNFVRNYGNIMSKNLGSIVLTDIDFEYYIQKETMIKI